MDQEAATAGDRVRLRLAPEPLSVGLARRFVRGHLSRQRVPRDAVEPALLVTSELVTNAYRHGEGEIELIVSVSEDRVRIEVIDRGRDQAPAVREQTSDDTGGWGLRIVDQLAVQWGVFEGTTHVWADLELS